MDFPHLNDMQKKAVMATEGPLLLLAGAGSGKTTVLINRIINLLKYGSASDCSDVQENITEADLMFLEEYLKKPDTAYKSALEEVVAYNPAKPWRIMAITFTNKAANELKDRLRNVLGPSADDIWAMTFHSACVRILRRDISSLGFSSSFTIYDTSDSVSLMKRIMKDLNISDRVFQPRYLLSAISKAKDDLMTPEAFAESVQSSPDPRQKVISQAYKEYSKRLFDSNALDFDDLIYYTVRLLQQNDEIRKYYQNLFEYVLVDEYQDTNNLQYMLVTLLSGGRRNICVVGDDDQSIYKFRGATIKNILDFENQYSDARTIRLEQNYRSTSHILGAANDVIKNNQGRKSKTLWTDKKAGNKLSLYRADSEMEEAQYVAEKILLGIAAGGKWRDYAVLYRMNTLSKSLEYAFKRNGIPYKIYGGTGFFERSEVKDMIAYLCVIANTGDELRLVRIINSPSRGIGAKTIDSLRALSQEHGVSMFEIIESAGNYPELSRSGAKLASFANIINELRQASESVSLDILYDMLLDKSGYVVALETSNDPQDDTRKENVLELKSSIISYISSTESPSLEGFLSEIALYTDLDNMSNDDDFVSMMTIHSSKGLEFPNVFIVGAEDGIFPSVRSIGEPDEMEEERRLCYVAVTRAKENLCFTCSKRRMLHGKTSANPISRFIDEMSSEHIDKPAEYFYMDSFDRYDDDFGGRSSYTEYGSNGFGSGSRFQNEGYERQRSVRRSYDFESETQPSQKVYTPKKRSLSAQAPVSAPLPDYKEGDRIKHTAFGAGTITSIKPTGNDALISIEFDSAGTKRLMLKTASRYMTKEG